MFYLYSLKLAASYGIDPMEIARASVLGQPVHLLSPLVASTFLLVGMVGVDLGEHQRFAFKWASFNVSCSDCPCYHHRCTYAILIGNKSRYGFLLIN